MEKDLESQKIKCPIFKARNESIEKIIKAINEAKNAQQKAMNAQKLLNEVGDLLACEYFKAEKLECKICRDTVKLRRRIADLIIKTQVLNINKK